MPILPINQWPMSQNIIILFVVAILYFITGYFGLLLALPYTNATPIWPPSGLALAGILLCGYRVMWSIFFGSMFVNIYVISTHLSNPELSLFNIVLISIATGLGAALEAAFAAFLIRLFTSEHFLFQSTASTLKFFMITFLSCCINATIGATAAWMGNLFPSELYLKSWFTWWGGDVGGIFLITPLILSWVKDFSFIPQWSTKKFWEAAFLTIVSAMIIFIHARLIDYYNLTYLFLPLLIWAAVRFNMRGATLLVFLFIMAIVLETFYGSGPFQGMSLDATIAMLVAFVIVVSASVLILAAELQQRKQPQAVWQGSNQSLNLLRMQVKSKLKKLWNRFHK